MINNIFSYILTLYMAGNTAEAPQLPSGSGYDPARPIALTEEDIRMRASGPPIESTVRLPKPGDIANLTPMQVSSHPAHNPLLRVTG